MQSFAQFLALCAALLLGGCGGNGVSSAPYVPPCPSFPCEAPTAQKLQMPDDAEFEKRKKEFEDAQEYRPWGTFLVGRTSTLVIDRHKDQIKASAAYARGATGKGEIVAVSDSDIDIEYSELASKVTVVGPLIPTMSGHGEGVASMIAGKIGGGSLRPTNMHGVAFDAMLVFQQVDLSSDFPGDVPNKLTDLEVLTEEDSKAMAARYFNIEYARAAGAGIINHSFAKKGPIDRYPEELVRAKFKYSAAALEQKGVPPADKVIVVQGAGNEGDDCIGICERGAPPVNPASPGLFAGLGVHFPELREHVLAVVAVGQDGLLADFSNPCGIAKIFCLAAPGENLLLPHRRFGGTSGAAALVSGSLALLRQYFRDENGARQLGSTELTARLLATADRTGTYANSDKYGHGLLDLDAATAPVGALATSLSTDPNARPFNPAAFSLSGNAFGGAMRDALGGVKIAAFDELDAPFFFPLADGVSHAPQISAGHSDTLHEHELSLGGAANASLALSLAAGELSAARIRRGNLWFSYGHHGGREAGLYFGDDGKNAIGNFGMNFSAETPAENFANAARHFRAPLAFASPYLSLVRDGPGLGWSQPLRSGARFGFSLMHGAPQFDHFQNPGGARGLGALFDFRPNNTSLSLQAGAVREADGFLGARAQGNFGEISADTAFAGIGGDWAALQNWRLLASAYLGHTKADTGDGMLRAADDIVSSAFSLGLARASLARRGDWLGLRLSQPLRAESGAAHLRIPAGRTKYREVIHRQHKLELTPSGRNLQVEAEYRVPFAGGNLRAGLGFDRHANHDRARDLETFLRLGFERRF